MSPVGWTAPVSALARGPRVNSAGHDNFFYLRNVKAAPKSEWAGGEPGPLQLFDDRTALRKQFDVADAVRGVAAEEDAVRIGRIDVDTTRILLRIGQREFRELVLCRIKAEDLVDLLCADPDELVLFVGNDRIHAQTRRLGRVDRHLLGLVVDLHELADFPQSDPEIAI